MCHLERGHGQGRSLGNAGSVMQPYGRFRSLKRQAAARSQSQTANEGTARVISGADELPFCSNTGAQNRMKGGLGSSGCNHVREHGHGSGTTAAQTKRKCLVEFRNESMELRRVLCFLRSEVRLEMRGVGAFMG